MILPPIKTKSGLVRPTKGLRLTFEGGALEVVGFDGEAVLVRPDDETTFRNVFSVPTHTKLGLINTLEFRAMSDRDRHLPKELQEGCFAAHPAWRVWGMVDVESQNTTFVKPTPETVLTMLRRRSSGTKEATAKFLRELAADQLEGETEPEPIEDAETLLVLADLLESL